MNELDIFYGAWVRNHRDNNRKLIYYYYAKYQRQMYLSFEEAYNVYEIQRKYGEHIMSLIIPYIKDNANKINKKGTYIHNQLIVNTNVYNLTDNKMPL
jgi:hypothetical protein